MPSRAFVVVTSYPSRDSEACCCCINARPNLSAFLVSTMQEMSLEEYAPAWTLHHGLSHVAFPSSDLPVVLLFLFTVGASEGCGSYFIHRKYFAKHSLLCFSVQSQCNFSSVSFFMHLKKNIEENLVSVQESDLPTRVSPAHFNQAKNVEGWKKMEWK